MATLTDSQLGAISIAERVGSSLSAVGILFILITYIFSHSFNKPINRLIFFASWGNLGGNIGALISDAGPATGPDSALCQLQGFLIQMFLGVDVLWVFCMAVNVYLVFFKDYTVEQLRALDARYLICCYGISFIPALAYLFISTDRGKIYGPATLWCWVTSEYDYLRIALLYGIVWLAILLAGVIYAMAGRQIWRRRDQIQGFLNPMNENPFVTTEVTITHEDRVAAETGPADGDHYSSYNPYTVEVNVEKTQSRQLPPVLRMREITRTAAITSQNAEAWLYARVAFLFFVVILITWVPSSINRFNSLVHPNTLNFPLNFISSMVLPLQGFWNVIVYIVTSQTACRNLWNNIFHRRGGSRGIEGMSNGDKNGDINLRRLDGFTKMPSGTFGTSASSQKDRPRFDSDGTSVVSLARVSREEQQQQQQQEEEREEKA